MIIRSFVGAVLAVWWASGVSAQPAAPRQMPLNAQLVEISGLAAASENTVFAHNDEFAIVYEIDIRDGTVLRAFALGNPTTQGDFEGIAAYEGRIYLVTSAGKLYEADISDHRARTRFNIYDTGVGAFCEVEGLSLAPKPGEFFILCKRPRKGGPDGRLSIYTWSLAERRPVDEPTLSVEFRDFLPGSEREGFRPAGIEWDAAAQTIMVVSSRSQIIYSFDAEGKFLRKNRLSAKNHPQSEGLAVLSSGVILVADEGNGRNGVGLLSAYDELP